MALRRSLPGFSVAVSGTARRWPSRGSSGATARSVTVTKEESGTMRPCAVRTNVFSRSLGSSMVPSGACARTGMASPST